MSRKSTSSKPGKNYGWNRKEGTFLFDPSDGTVTPDPSPDPAFTDPVLEYSHADGSAVIGGFIDHGTGVPALNGLYVFGDLAAHRGLRRHTGACSTPISPTASSSNCGSATRSATLDYFSKASARTIGEVYVLGDANIGPTGNGGIVYKIVSIAPSPAILNLSTRLNVETGDNVLIGGFIVTGSDGEEVVLRGIGPSLQVNGVPLAGSCPIQRSSCTTAPAR